MKNFSGLYTALLIVLSSMIFSTCARNPVTGKKELMLMSESQEKAIGAESDPAIVQSFGLYDDDELQNYIQQNGERMAEISHRPELDYTFRLLDSPVVNAFAVPGGYIYFTRGIMAHFNNEAEFMGVLGHEIGHVAARHSAQQYSKQVVAQLGLVGASIASETFRDFANEASQGLGLLFLKFGRDDERQSDELGVEYSTKVGYDAHQMADFFQTLDRLQEQSGQIVPTFLSTHPNPANRYNKVHKLADEAQRTDPGTNYEVGRNRYLNLIEGIIYGNDPKQGYTDNNVFYHPELLFKFPYPSEWFLINSPTQVQMAPKDGEAVMIFTLAKESTPDAAAQAAVENFNLRVIDSKRTTVNGFPAYVVLADQIQETQQSTQQQPQLRILSYFIQYDGIVYVFHGVSTVEKYNNYDRDFKGTMTNFSRLTDQSRINVVATRIDIKKVNRTGTLQQALVDLGAAGSDLEELSILNGKELTAQVAAGDLVKVFTKQHNK